MLSSYKKNSSYMNIFYNFLEKIIFFDKYLVRITNNNKYGVIKIEDNLFVDIPKVGSSTLKNYVALKSKRYRFCNKFLKFYPVHTCINFEQEINVKNQDKIYVFLRSPAERLYSIYKQKVLNYKEFPFGYSLIKRKYYFANKFGDFQIKFSRKDTFCDFCNGIFNIYNEIIKNNYDINIFDKHLISQQKIILNLIEIYPNIEEFKFIIYPINQINNVIGKLIKKKKEGALNSSNKSLISLSGKSNLDKIVSTVYLEDKLLYENLINSRNKYLETNYDFVKHII